MTTSLILPILSAVVLIAGALGIAYAIFRSTTVTKTVELYKGENEVQGKAIARQATALIDQEARIGALERENAVLRNLVVGHEQLDLLVKDSAERHLEHTKQIDVLCEIKELLAEMWRPMVKALIERDEPQ